MRVYLDNASTTPLSPEVIAAMTATMQEQFGNPSSIHAEGRKVRASIEKARKTIASYLNASIGEIFFTSGGTESNNMALKCSVRDLGVKRIISSPVEHHCVMHTLDGIAEHNGTEIILLDIDEYGHVDLAQLESLLSMENAPKTLVSLMHANNEIGTLLDLERVANMCKENAALFHSDTVQTVSHYRIDVEKTAIDFLSGSAHKFHGPKGIGFVYINGGNSLKPFMDGGSQERNMRGGTENVYGIVGLATAITEAYDNLDAWRKSITEVRQYLIDGLKSRFQDIQFNTPLNEESLYTVLSASFPHSPKSDLLLLSLDIAGISCSGGSACSSGSEKGSHVIQALKKDPLRKTVRFSFSHYSSKADIDFLLAALEKLVVVEKQQVA